MVHRRRDPFVVNDSIGHAEENQLLSWDSFYGLFPGGSLDKLLENIQFTTDVIKANQSCSVGQLYMEGVCVRMLHYGCRWKEHKTITVDIF